MASLLKKMLYPKQIRGPKVVIVRCKKISYSSSDNDNDEDDSSAYSHTDDEGEVTSRSNSFLYDGNEISATNSSTDTNSTTGDDDENRHRHGSGDVNYVQSFDTYYTATDDDCSYYTDYDSGEFFLAEPLPTVERQRRRDVKIAADDQDEDGFEVQALLLTSTATLSLYDKEDGDDRVPSQGDFWSQVDADLYSFESADHHDYDDAYDTAATRHKKNIVLPTTAVAGQADAAHHHATSY